MKALLALLLIFVFLQTAIAAPDEAVGRVVSVVSGDSFGIEIQAADPRTKHIDSVRLADVVSPSTVTREGKDAKKFAASALKNKTVYLDIDDNSADGRNEFGQLICVVYLMDSSSRPVWPPFNRILVDNGHALVNDDKNNEFNATAWWGAPPQMSVKRSWPAVGSISYRSNGSNESISYRSNESILEQDPNSSLISIGYRRY